jgi:formylglycine-generating enzyme required for sulfatase activity
MSGNVWEWCLNEWQQYGLGSVGLESEDERAVRGGSWSDSANAARIKERRSFVRPFAQGNNIGFRIVTDAV